MVCGRDSLPRLIKALVQLLISKPFIHLEGGSGPVGTTPIDPPISPIEGTVCSARYALRLTILDAAAQTVQISLAKKHVFVGLLELENDCVHPVDRLLESLKIRCNRHDILVQSADLKLVILEITLDILLVSLRIDKLLELCHIELIPYIDHTLVPPHQFLLKLHLELIY